MAAGKLLDFTNYLLYTAKASNQPKIKDFATSKARDAKDEKFLGKFQFFRFFAYFEKMKCSLKVYFIMY